MIGWSDEDCSTSGSSWVQSRRSADGFLIFGAVRGLLGFELKDLSSFSHSLRGNRC